MAVRARSLWAGLCVMVVPVFTYAQDVAEDAPPPPTETSDATPAADEGGDTPPTEETPPTEATPPAGESPPTDSAAPADPAAVTGLSTGDQMRLDALWDEGDQLYGTGRYKEAIEKYLAAYEILPKSDLLYSVATAYQQLENWQDCVTYMDRFLADAKPGPKRDRAENSRKSCDARIVRDQLLNIDSDPPGAQVYVDDRERGVQGSTPYRNYVRPGAHVIWVELKGYEPIKQEIEVQVKQPFHINVAMRKRQNLGYLYVDSTIAGATVFIDGKKVGQTPFNEPLSYPAGRHQVVVTRDGYTRFDKHVSVQTGATRVVDAYLVQTIFVSTWRSSIGWTANVFGLLSVAAGVVFWQLADREFNDTKEFDRFAQYEKLGHGVGGGLLALGTGLIIWDRARDVVLDEHRNPTYGEPPQSLDARRSPRSGEWFARGAGFGFEF